MTRSLRSLLLAACLLAFTTLAPSAANFGLSGGDGGTPNTATGVEGLFKGDSGVGPEMQPEGGGMPQAVPAGPTPAVELAYDGHAHADDRRAHVSFVIAPDGTVTGTISIASICEQNVHLGGADLTFSGTLTGTWESREGSIDGTWQGTEHFCGTNSPNEGTFKFFRNEQAAAKPVLHLRIMGKNGRYGWDFPPSDRIYATGANASTATPGETGANSDGTVATDTPTTGGDSSQGGDKVTGPTSEKDGERPVSEGQTTHEPDPDSVTAILLVPQEVPIVAGQNADLPVVLAVVGDTADKIAISSDKLEWTTAAGLSISGGKFEVSPKAQEGDRLGFRVHARLSLARSFDAEGVVHVISGRLGSISGAVFFYYRSPPYSGDPRRPVEATVELRSTRGGGALRIATTGPDGEYHFDQLPKGTYQVVVTGFRAKDFPPTGYRLKLPGGPWIGYWAAIPEYKSNFNPDPDTAKWDQTSVSTQIDLIGPDYDAKPNAVSGRVIYKGQGVSGVTVMANRLGSEGGSKSVTSGTDGRYALDVNDLEPGTYWLRAEKYVVPRWAGPDDLLDVASARDEQRVEFIVPFVTVDRLSIDIEVLTRNEIFGGERTPEQPTDLP
jgi:hypothetical protein